MNNNGEETSYTESGSDEILQYSATKIQTVWRGRMVRKETLEKPKNYLFPVENIAIEDNAGNTPEKDAILVPENNLAKEDASDQQAMNEADDKLRTSTPLTNNKDAIDSPDQNIDNSPRYTEDGKRLPSFSRVNYVGGYRDKRNGTEYYHAWTQTKVPQKYTLENCPERFHREVQTKFLRNRKSQCVRETATQMIIKIQCFFRKIQAIRYTRILYIEKLEKDKDQKEKEDKKIKIDETKRRKEVEHRLHPRSTKDFEVLYHGLERWRAIEVKKITDSEYHDATKLALLADVMDKEAQLIQKIDRLKLAANEENKVEKTQKLLEQMGSPISFPSFDGGTTFITTPSIQRASELRDLYNALCLPLLSIDERLQVLLHVKYTVKEFDCSLTRDIVDLIDREGDMISRGVSSKNLEGLRKRISSQFLVFLKTPKFNPEAAKYQKFPGAGESWHREKPVYYCRGCTKYLSSTEFYLSTNMNHVGKCKNCMLEENYAKDRVEDSAYMKLLDNARNEEEDRRKKELGPSLLSGKQNINHTVDLMQESDMRYLIDTIWGCQSIISATGNMEDLVLIRWNPKKELSPWNCILLTKPEALVHQKEDNPIGLYSSDFVKRVEQKHIQAVNHFSQLPKMQKYMKEAFYEEKRTGRVLHRKLVPLR
ncbi:hypothetical protein ROZALSC1DRAFT_29078 [Rozella allomycis CSF55]|uniref:IQ motif and ubiquitin-like domain-containing protein n=1 Tax=Rozella allomycis (strain CSF55) TaxID=988480 RepID=A0A4P9YIC2_ROZAC|nr:hypothetical protein ROZALSC1DRAFT_29078 [Rozella allomycis CSF55]